MTSQAGHIKESTEDENGFRQFIINCLGNNDQRKYFSLSPFGIDFNAPIDTRSLTIGSRNKDQKYNLGVLNKIKVDNLNKGESAIFSTDEAGDALISLIQLKNDGTIYINNPALGASIEIQPSGNMYINDISIGGFINLLDDDTIEINGDADNIAGFADLKSGFDTLKQDLNNLITAYNAHIHITTATVGATPTPGIIAPTVSTGTPSTASIDSSKKDNLKIE